MAIQGAEVSSSKNSLILRLLKLDNCSGQRIRVKNIDNKTKYAIEPWI